MWLDWAVRVRLVCTVLFLFASDTFLYAHSIRINGWRYHGGISRSIVGVHGIGTLPDSPQVQQQQPPTQQRPASLPPKPNIQLPPKPSYMFPSHANSSEHKKPPMPSPPSQRKPEPEVLYYIKVNQLTRQTHTHRHSLFLQFVLIERAQDTYLDLSKKNINYIRIDIGTIVSWLNPMQHNGHRD